MISEYFIPYSDSVYMHGGQGRVLVGDYAILALLLLSLLIRWQEMGVVKHSKYSTNEASVLDI